MDRRNVMISLVPSDRIPKEAGLFFEHSPDSVCSLNGKLYLQTGGPDVLCCEDNEAGNELVSALQTRYGADTVRTENRNDAWYQIITSTDHKRIETIAGKNRISEQKGRIAVVFQMKYPADQELSGIFSEIVPAEKGDHPVSISRDSLALIKDTEFRSEDEIAEYTAAVIDSIISEGFTDIQAGIGTEAGSIYSLHRSYEEARSALLTGTSRHTDGTLFRYSEQKLERIVDLIPPENRKRILEEYRSKCVGDAFSDEMMETVRVLFQHDLNITSASKQLFIHRNTLHYRLDKIKRDTGLDLRTFQDAVVFRLISEMTEKP